MDHAGERAAAVQQQVVALLYSDPARAAELVAEGRTLAEQSGSALADAYATRGEAHLAYSRGQHEQAARLYDQALERFMAEGQEGEAGRTLSSGLQTLILLSRYEQAREWAERAEAIFTRQGDTLRLARLDSNVGNIFFRMDRPRDALARYERALERFTGTGDAKDVAAALSNIAVCLMESGRLSEARATFERARAHCEANGLEPLAAQADYNIAYLCFLRGDYREAARLYGLSRERCVRAGDVYHAALCDLDEAEMSLELNLGHEGHLLAARAAERFRELGMRYEEAKALANLGVAYSQQAEPVRAERTLRQARALFVKERNGVWPALIDLWRAMLAYRHQRYAAARRLAQSAEQALRKTALAARAAQSLLLLARLWLRQGQADRARALIREAQARLGDESSPSLRFHSSLLEGEIHERQGRWREAQEAYTAAQREVEDLRGRLDREDLRISLLADKLEVYDALLTLCLERGAHDPARRREALRLVQQAKSRSLAERLSPGAARAQGPSASDAQTEEIRQELNWCYRQSELAIVLDRAGLPPALRLSELRARARELEAKLLHSHSRSQAEPAALGRALSVEELQAALPDHALIFEYFEARDVLHLFVLGRRKLEVLRLGNASPLRQTAKLLEFQLGRFRRDALESGGALAAVRHHLREAYEALIRPAEGYLREARHLIVAPHRQLHRLPFAALDDGRQALIDTVTLSYAPSASVFAACRARPARPGRGALVVGLPDGMNPHIEAEARLVAQTLPGAECCLGLDATAEALRQRGAGKRIIHLATHGSFRRDNPMFSSLRLADGPLRLLDVGDLRLTPELLTLSACSTGASVAAGADELLGLTRGFLAAGARSLLVSLWEIDDASTARFMRGFYGALSSGTPLAEAVRQAMLPVREWRPHPYHWAPFVLAGDPFTKENT